jgi:hypothetical protein
MRLLVAALLGMLAVAGAPAQEPDGLAMIVDQQQELREQIDAGDLQNLTPRQLNIVRRAQKEVFTVTEGKTALDSLSIEEKIRLENALEQINAQVKGGGHAASGAQEVCWRERKSGSSLKTTRCGTQAERDQARQDARSWMDKPSICTPPGCGT